MSTSWLDSPEALGRVATWTLWIGVTLAALGICSTAVSHFFRIRRDTLLAIPDRLARVERDTGARHLTGEQKRALLDILRPCPRDRVEIALVNADVEAETFAAELQAVFVEAGYDMPPIGRHIHIGSQERPPPFAMRVRSATQPPACAALVQSYLKSVGLEPLGVVDETTPERALRFHVSPRSIPQ